MTPPCPNCGSSANPPGSVFCMVCGKPLTVSSSASASSAGMLRSSSGARYKLSTVTPTLIGSRGCAILLSAAGVLEQHARILPSGGGFLVEPVMGVVQVNGAAVSAASPLPDGASLTIGSLTLVYSGPTALVPLSSSTTPVLTLPPVKFSPPPTPKMSSPSKLRTWITNLTKPKPPTLEGTILVLDGPHAEQPDVDWAGLVLRATFGLVLLPFLCWQPAFIIPFLLYGLGQRKSQVPTRYLRVEDSAGRQLTVKMKGDPSRGMLSMGDKGSFWGRWDGGTLVMTRARNLTTSSEVVLKTTLQHRTNQVILAIIGGLILLFWLAVFISVY